MFDLGNPTITCSSLRDFLQNTFSSQPLVSVIILNYNGEKFLRRCILSVLQSDYENFEIILVDNGSSDGSINTIRDLLTSPRIKLVRLNKNLGFSQGNNVGASYASGKYIVFLNNDTEVTCNWLKELVNLMEHNPQIGAAQPKLLYMSKNGEVQSAGNYIDTMGFTIPRVRLREERSKFNEPSEIAATGAALIIRRDLFSFIYGFEPNFFVYYEDTDLSWRVRLAGKSIFFVPSAIVFHEEGAGFGRVKLALRIYHCVKNHLFTVLKNYSTKNGFPRIFLLYLFYIVGAIWLARASPELSLSIFRALFKFFRMFRECWQSHLIVQNRIRKIEDRELFQHFLKPFNPFRLFQFYRRGMGYTSIDYPSNSTK